MSEARAFSSPWTLRSPYWIVVFCADAKYRASITPILKQAGAEQLHGDAAMYGWKAGADWASAWEGLAGAMKDIDIATALKAVVIPSETLPSHQEVILSLRSFAEIDAVAANLWLARALEEDRLICCMQRVVDRRGKLTGYEAFARIEQKSGDTVSGGAVMQASHALRVEYHVDRIMHRRAIQSFVEFDLEGFIFINFLTGFIHRPEVYLEGLSQAVEQYHVVPRSVVLDVPVTDHGNNLAKIKTIATYCRSRGFAIALDDVTRPDGLGAFLNEIHPAFVKLHGRLGPAMVDPKRQGPVREIIRLSHEAGATVLAEEVETEEHYKAFLEAGADMFQGYYIGAPERYSPRQNSRANG